MQKEFEGKDKQIGVLITNLGTPDSPTKQGLKKYLNQFLMVYILICILLRYLLLDKK